MRKLYDLIGFLPGQASRLPPRPRVPPTQEAKPGYQGYIEQISRFHVEGWVHNLADLSERTALAVRRGDTGEVIATDVANHFRFGLSGIGVGDGGHGFHIRFPNPLPPEAVSKLEVLPTPAGHPLPKSPRCTDAYEPMMLISMDIVDNCNLRCPFCLYDYTGVRTTNVMDEATIDAALRFLPYVTDANFWFSCLHEPTLHPDLMKFISKVPREWRRKLFYTTNLAKRMPPDYYPWLADAGLHHVNISIESRDPAVYENLRKGARFHIFQENWDLLIKAASQHPNPTPIHYIAMVYRSNYRELPGLVKYLIEERRGAHVELRFTFDMPFMPSAFRDSEFLHAEGWLWLRDQLSGYSAQQVRLILPPKVTPRTPATEFEATNRTKTSYGIRVKHDVRHFLPGRYQARLSWNGQLEISPYWAHPFEEGPGQKRICTVNVRDIQDPIQFLFGLPV
jgi:molybdenum cofactor biosynthesis enzyme MoaA